MCLNKLVKTTALLLICLFLFTPISYGGFTIPDTDSSNSFLLFSFFDLRDRESFVQVTNLNSFDGVLHVQIFDVSNNCNENNFFDTYTPSDTHVYNMRDIQTNDGTDAGVVLPDGAYGFVAIFGALRTGLIGNFRVIDENGYEYRTNSLNPLFGSCCWGSSEDKLTFNYNIKGDVTLSDVIGIPVRSEVEVEAADITDIYFTANIDILNENQVIFSCRNVIFACTDQDNPLLEALLEESGAASVASFEYGINNAIPHSRGGELLCPGNTISDGFVTISQINNGNIRNFVGFIGLNNGNGRGSMDSFWYPMASIICPT